MADPIQSVAGAGGPRANMPLDDQGAAARRAVAARPGAGRPPGEDGKLLEAAQELEGVFLGMLLKSMRATVMKGGLLKEGLDAQTYHEIFDQEVARVLARHGGIGLADMVVRQEGRRAPVVQKTPQGPPSDIR